MKIKKSPVDVFKSFRKWHITFKYTPAMMKTLLDFMQIELKHTSANSFQLFVYQLFLSFPEVFSILAANINFQLLSK